MVDENHGNENRQSLNVFILGIPAVGTKNKKTG